MQKQFPGSYQQRWFPQPLPTGGKQSILPVAASMILPARALNLSSVLFPALEQPLQLPDVESTPEVSELHEPLYRVLLHNDEITPFEYVMSILGKVFMLSEELAEHIAVTAHSEGVSIVIIRHRSEAQRLSEVANRSARADGFPLTFTCEPDV